MLLFFRCSEHSIQMPQNFHWMILRIIFVLDNLNKVYFRVDKNISVCKINLRQIAVSAIISTLGSKLNNLVGFKEVL